jgi:hypothetical protein
VPEAPRFTAFAGHHNSMIGEKGGSLEPYGLLIVRDLMTTSFFGWPPPAC